LSDSIATLSRNLADTLNSASAHLATKLDSATDQAESRFTNTVAKLDSLLERARGTVDAGTSSAESTERIIARFADIAAKLEQAQHGFSKIAEPVQRASEKLDTVAERVRQASEAIERSAQHSQAIQERVSASWTQASDRFTAIDRDLAKIFTDLNGGLASYASTVNDFNGKLTTEFTKALGSLQGIVGELDETLQEMQGLLQVAKATR
jgi:methyl-accepting chemotaxis protein